MRASLSRVERTLVVVARAIGGEHASRYKGHAPLWKGSWPIPPQYLLLCSAQRTTYSILDAKGYTPCIGFHIDQRHARRALTHIQSVDEDSKGGWVSRASGLWLRILASMLLDQSSIHVTRGTLHVPMSKKLLQKIKKLLLLKKFFYFKNHFCTVIKKVDNFWKVIWENRKFFVKYF